MKIQLPNKLEPVFKPYRYKILYGGRGSSKSWSVARILLTLGTTRRLRILCAREFQGSIADSVHKLLCDQIFALGMSDFYEILQSSIRGKNGTEFFFFGLRHNVNKIKSVEGADIAWVEEAQAVSQDSWNTLIPTIRKEGSEIWVTFNPEFEEDETYQRFVINPPSDSLVIKINYWDNPWFPDVLRSEMEALKARSLSMYLNVWEGECITAQEGAVYNLGWFARHHSLPQPPNRTMVVLSVDSAYKAKTHNDPSCILEWHVTPTLYYLADVQHGRWEYPELRRRVFNTANDKKPDAVLIEDKASGQSLIQELRQGTAHPVIAIHPEADKETRARTTAAVVEAGRVSLPVSAPWLGEYEREILLCPHGKFWDRIDATSQFLRWMTERGGDSDKEFMAMMDRLYGR